MESVETLNNGFKSAEQQLTFHVDEKHVGVRLDQFLALQVLGLSRSQISDAIREKNIIVNGTPRKNSYRLKLGEFISGVVEHDKPIEVCGEHIEFTVLYEDQWLLFLSKPPGLVVHPGSGNHAGTLVNGLVHYCEGIAAVGDAARPGIVHRLDKDTSGVMVVAKTEAVHRDLINLFKEHQLEKEYLCLVQGVPKESSGRIVAAIGRHHINRQKMAVKDIGGKHAATNWDLVERYDGGLSLLQVNIETGRTHQIRVHMAHLGYPVAGDCVYGTGKTQRKFPRQMLHASRLSFNHPVTGKKLDIIAPLWNDFVAVLDQLQAVSGESS
ncbi:RluA family pseudouridine synthase [Desulforhopalus sp. IMCC35007]|uniref:RluA family pseudouridine synthase n=1 Tax=Desulforhopalus sp. IMCC35007 TaxID=2569543 RepID=UPI0010ADE5D6|nr:RluA family pseudouridine synthase [Desulforhopalus sp. IMCC35007]TKB09023.1 RluA family pseudouridine synthase [Desulforhopalus sp. IMCC35007]